MTTQLVHVGFGGIVAAQRIVAIVSPDSAPVRRLVQQAKEREMAIDMTYGRKTKAVIILDSGHVAMAAIQPETIMNRLYSRKDVTINRLRQLGHSFRFVVTATTRPPRPAEVNGQDYFFVSHCEFERMIVAGELLEHARVYGEYKGIPKSQVREALASGFDVVLRVDVQGAERLRELMPGAVSIFLAAPSEQELVERLRSRKTETAEAFRQRVATAQREMQEIHHFDYVVINRDGELDCTVERIMAIITAEKSRAIPRKVEL